MRRYISPYVFSPVTNGSLAIVEIKDGDIVDIKKFEGETAATNYIPNPIVILNKTKISEFLLDDLESMASGINFRSCLHSYLKSSDLFPHSSISSQSEALAFSDAIAIEISPDSSTIL